ncbi:MAG: hypothetical protein IK075_10680 [Prevotella sp.]|nr:hypothetical protein [Prevotella sp.]
MKQLVLLMIVAMGLSTTALAQKRVKNIYASSSKLDIEMMQSSEQTVQLNRYFFAGYNTLCLPFSLTAEQVAVAAKDLKVERLAGIQQEGATLNLYFVDCTDEGIQAGLPYLVFSPTSQYLRVKNTDVLNFDPELKSVRMTDDKGNIVTFGSSWESLEKVGRYGIPAKQNVTPLESVLVRTEADKTFLPTRCGFTWVEQAESANDLKIQHAASKGEVTAILGVKLDNTTDGDSYDLQGHKTSKNAKGIRIQNGKKTIVR